MELTRQVFSELKPKEIMELTREVFPDLKPKEIMELTRQLFPLVLGYEAGELIRSCFRDLEDMELFGLQAEFFPFDRVIEQLTKMFRGNFQKAGTVAITASSAQQGAPMDAADLSTERAFFSANQLGQWIYYDFKTRMVRPTHYSIRADARLGAEAEASRTG
jgi:hypothetical protein